MISRRQLPSVCAKNTKSALPVLPAPPGETGLLLWALPLLPEELGALPLEPRGGDLEGWPCEQEVQPSDKASMRSPAAWHMAPAFQNILQGHTPGRHGGRMLQHQEILSKAI
eukprot:scaffold41980_cov20-Tisochrysis_lutea.AAC.1